MRTVKFSLTRYLKLISISFVGMILFFSMVMASTAATAFTIPLKRSICCETPSNFGAWYENMSFKTANGLTLSGWYIPSKNGAAVILIHAYYGDRRQSLPVAEMLSKHGFGVLMYDQRASGESEGWTRSFGWLDVADVSQAAEWVNARPDVIPGKIGGYGCSMGAAIALAGSVKTPSIAALALDAPSPLHWRENLPGFSLQNPLSLPVSLGVFGLVALRSGSLPPTTTVDAIRAYTPRPILFISTGQSDERQRISSYYALADEPKQHWNIPSATHCGGTAYFAAYEQHLVNFFTTTLLKK